MGLDLSKKDLYESVKALVDNSNKPHIHLVQHKLFTLFSIAFQYILFTSSKNPGAYIIRIENSNLAEKLARKAKDPSTRKFLQSLLLPRKFKYHRSTFFLDFFHLGTWGLTNDIPKDKLKAAIIIKNTSNLPMSDTQILNMTEAEGEAINEEISDLPEHYYLSSLQSIVPKTITIAFDANLPDVYPLSFPFIKEEKKGALSGVTISKELDLDKLKD